MSYKALAVFLLQIIITIVFALFAIDVQQNNSLDNFTVNSADIEHDYSILMENFSAQGLAIISLELKDNGTDNVDFAEDIISQISCEQGVSYLSFLNQIPGSLRYQISQEVTFEKLHKELLFPFVKDNYYNAILLFDKETNIEETLGRILFKLEFLKVYQENILNIVIIGEPVVNYYLGQSSLEVRNKFFPAIIVFCMLVMIVVFRSIKVILAWLVAMLSALTVSMGIFSLSGNELNLITNLIPILIFVLSTAMHMHILLSLTKFSSLRRGLLEKLLPNFLVSLTTSIGFGSLMASEVKPIYLLGKYTSISIWFIFIFCYVTHLGFSVIFSLKLYNKKFSLQSFPILNLSGKGFSILLLIPVFVIFCGGFIIQTNPLESNGLHYFSSEHSIRQNTDFIEKNITGSSSIEILIPRIDKNLFIDSSTYEKIYSFEKKLKKMPEIYNVVSLCQYIQFAQKSSAGFDYYDEDTISSIDEETLNILQHELMESNGKAFSELINSSYYRLQIVCKSLNSDHYDLLKQQIYSYQNELTKEKIVVTGTLERIIQIQKYLLSSLASSLLITIASSIVLMSLFLKSWHIVYLSFIPNLFPLGVMGIILFIANFPTTIGTVMVFSIAFGIAVDSTIHLFHCYREHPKNSYEERWKYSLDMNAAAIGITTIVLLGAFLLIGVLSSFTPTAQFGILLAIGMLAAWIGDIYFLPITLRYCKWL